MIADVLHALAKENVAAGLAIAAVLPARRLVRRWLGAQTAYALWLAVPLAVAGACVPARKIIVPLHRFAPVHASPPTSAPADYSPLLLGLWIAGIALSLAILVERQRRFRASLGPLTPERDGVLRAERSGGPAVLGFFSPRVVLPADFETRFSAAEREAILAHEQGHLRAGHLQTNVLAALVKCLCWFNPLVHLASDALRVDQEMACDAAALSRSAIGSRQYGEVLLRAQLNAPPLPFGCYWPPNGARALKDRLMMLKTPNPSPPARLAGAVVISLAACGSAVAGWAAQPAQVQIALQPPAPAALARAVAPATTLSVEAAEPPHVTISNSVLGHKDVVNPPKPPATDNEITAPDWIDRPTSADLAGYYPEDAAKQEVQGLAMIRCQVGETGKPRDCSILSETPDGAHFGDAALKMAETFTMKPPSGGASGTVIIPIKFQLQ